MKQSIVKFVVLGAESTGKSTITGQLAAHFNTTFVPEYARMYLETLDRPYTYADLLEIAKGQIRTEERQAQQARNGLLFCDTDLHVIKVWSEHKYGRCDPWILEQLAIREYDFYWLTDIDLPWIDDPLREHPQPHMRQHFFRIYENLIRNTGKPWQRLSGDPAARLQTAINKVNEFLQNQDTSAKNLK